MGEWQPIETAPKDGTHLLLWARPAPNEMLGFSSNVAITGYFDQMDGAWCSTCATWTGPFLIDVEHWMPLPEAP